MRKLLKLGLLPIFLTLGVEASELSKDKLEQTRAFELEANSVTKLVEKQKELLKKIYEVSKRGDKVEPEPELAIENIISKLCLKNHYSLRETKTPYESRIPFYYSIKFFK